MTCTENVGIWNIWWTEGCVRVDIDGIIFSKEILEQLKVNFPDEPEEVFRGLCFPCKTEEGIKGDSGGFLAIDNYFDCPETEIPVYFLTEGSELIQVPVVLSQEDIFFLGSIYENCKDYMEEYLCTHREMAEKFGDFCLNFSGKEKEFENLIRKAKETEEEREM